MIKYRRCVEDLTAYVPGKPIEDVKKEYGISNVVKIASNENPHGCSPKAMEAAIEALSQIAIYPDGNCTALKTALAEKYDVTTDRIILGCGTDEIISLLGKTFIEEGDECITGDVTFSQYAASVESMGGKMVYVPLKNHVFDLEEILERINPKTKMIFIANPNNPTGTIYEAEAQLNFLKRVPSNILIAIDEAYGEFVQNPKYPDTSKLLSQYPNIVYLKTFSKVYGLASLRVGFGIADVNIIEPMNRVRNPFNVSTPAQMAALAALQDDEFVKKTVKNNQEVLCYLYKNFDEIGLSYIPSETNFVMIDTKMDSREIFVELMKRGYIIRPGAAFGMDTYLRVTVGILEQMQGFITALREVLDK